MKTLTLIALAMMQSCGAGVSLDTGNQSETTQQALEITTKRVFSKVTLQNPVVMLQEPKDKSYWYVVQQTGAIVRFKKADGNLATREVFADLSGRIVSGGERGLLGLAFHPNYPDTAKIYVNYTGNFNSQLHTIISSFDVSGSRIVLNSEKILLRIQQPYANHNGGHIAFGPDGYLYIATGDGGSGGDPHNNSQNKNSLLGKILRIDIEKSSDDLAYANPSDNPFVNKDGLDEIFAYGLRNPWKFSFDTQLGTLWAADVGQNQWEEVNIIQNGGNYGWKIREGKSCYQAVSCTSTNLISPIVQYDRSNGQSITGGHVYRGTAIPTLVGYYIYGDFITGRLWGVNKDGKIQELPKTSYIISAFGQDQNGEIYILDYGKGQIFQLAANP